MAIPTLLEKMILEGKAVFRVHTHAWSMFGSIPIPAGKLVIITSIKWNHFISPYPDTSAAADNGIVNTLRYNNYQLKLESKLSKNYFQYRNGIGFSPTVGISGTAGWTSNNVNTRAWPWIVNPPEITDVYLSCVDFIKITVSRNAFANANTSTNGVVSSAANEEPPPNGVKGVTLVTRVAENSLTPSTMYNTPAGDDMAGLASPGDRNTRSFSQDIDPTNSRIYGPDSVANTQIKFPFITSPLVEISHVVINTNEFDNIISS